MTGLRRSKYKRQACMPLLSLPVELQHKVCRFLSAADAVALSKTCQEVSQIKYALTFVLIHSKACSADTNLLIFFSQLQATCPLSLLDPLPWFRQLGWPGHPTEGERRHNSHLVVPLIMLPDRLHSIRLEFSWKDQGWGNQKGQIYIVGRPVTAKNKNKQKEQGENAGSIDSNAHPADRTDDWSTDCRIVYESSKAPHAFEKLVLWFTPRVDEYYSLWYKVGSGGGHTLSLRDGFVSYLLHDNADRSYRQNFTSLKAVDLIPVPLEQQHAPPFYSQLLMSVVESLIRQHQQEDSKIDPQLVSVMQQHGFVTSLSSLKVLLEVFQAAQALTMHSPEQQSLMDADHGGHHHHHPPIRLGRIHIQVQPPLHAGGAAVP
jgi:hypothetical protein